MCVNTTPQVQQDEMKPRQIESFRGRIMALPDGVVSVLRVIVCVVQQ
jgi:hypothetical protein